MIYGQNFKLLWYDQKIPKPNKKTIRKSPNSNNSEGPRVRASPASLRCVLEQEH